MSGTPYYIIVPPICVLAMSLILAHHQAMADAVTSETQEKPRKKRGCLARLFLGGLTLFAVICGLGWYFLPQIADRVIMKMLEDADLKRADFRVREVKWNSATFDQISLADNGWSMTAEKMQITYAPQNLLNGEVGKITIWNAACVLDLPEKDPDSAGKPLEIKGIGKITELVARIGSFQADDMSLTLKRDDRKFVMPAAVFLKSEGADRFGAQIRSADFVLDLGMATENAITAMTADFSEVNPERFLELVELGIDYDGHFLPKGTKITSANLVGVLRFKNDKAGPLSLRGTLDDVQYDGGEKPIDLNAKAVEMELTQNFGDAGSVVFSGSLERLNIPLDLEKGTAFSLRQNGNPHWSARIRWGGEKAGVQAVLENFAIAGTYQKIPFSLNQLEAEIDSSGEIVSAKAHLSHQDASVPITYHHKMKNSQDGGWILLGALDFEPIDLEKLAPSLKQIDALDGVTLGGNVSGVFDFKIGSDEKLSGELEAKISDASLAIGEQVSIEGIDGKATFYIQPNAQLSTAQLKRWPPKYLRAFNLPPDYKIKPDQFSFKLTGKKLRIAAEKALDFDLFHDDNSPISISGKGSLGELPRIEVGIKNLDLHGSNGKKSLALSEGAFEFAQINTVSQSAGDINLGGNPISFIYQHDKKTTAAGWLINGVILIISAEIKDAIDDEIVPLAMLAGKKFSGKLAAICNFSVGSDQNFDGKLVVDLEDGKLLFADEGPVIGGIKGKIALDSLKPPQTKDFYRFTAEKMTAADIEMTGLRADVKVLPDGAISIKNTALAALGGLVWTKPFVIPADDGDFKFTVQMRQISLPELAKLFPDFNGNITGKIDGILPIERVKGEYLPKRGGMQLSPDQQATLSYDAGDSFSGGLKPDGQKYQQMRLLEKSLKALDLKTLDIRLFDPKDKDKAIILRLEGQADSVKGSPPIILNINGFKPDDDSTDFFDLLLRHRDKLNFGL